MRASSLLYCISGCILFLYEHGQGHSSRAWLVSSGAEMVSIFMSQAFNASIMFP